MHALCNSITFGWLSVYFSPNIDIKRHFLSTSNHPYRFELFIICESLQTLRFLYNGLTHFPSECKTILVDRNSYGYSLSNSFFKLYANRRKSVQNGIFRYRICIYLPKKCMRTDAILDLIVKVSIYAIQNRWCT